MRLVFVLLAANLPLLGQIIEGRVTNSVTGAPVGSVAVTIESNGKPAYHATTDTQGAFRLDGLKPGYYTVNFSKSDFLEPEGNSPARRPFHVPPGSDPVRLEVKLTPLGKIMGRVLDTNGDPLPGAEVLLDSSRFGRSVSSDKDGRFSFQVTPGRYTLLAKPPSELKPPPAVGTERLGWVPTYYPGVLDARAAVRIVLNAGAELFGNDIKLRAASMRRVRGIVLDGKRDPAPRVTVRTARTDETLFEDVEAVSADDGGFEFPDLYDGEWSIFAETEGNGVKFKASAVAMVGDRDVDGLELRLTTPFSIRGNISFDGTGKPPGKISVLLRPAVIAGSQGLNQAVIDTSGTFRIDNVYPGAYKVVAVAPGPPYYLAALKIGDRDILGQSVEFYPGSLPIQIAFESKGGGVQGIVEDCGGATVVLAPQDKALQEPQFVQFVKCGDGGRFEIGNVRPGDYYAFAFDRWEGPIDLLANLGQSMINKAVSVRVNSGENTRSELHVSTREP